MWIIKFTQLGRQNEFHEEDYATFEKGEKLGIYYYRLSNLGIFTRNNLVYLKADAILFC